MMRTRKQTNSPRGRTNSPRGRTHLGAASPGPVPYLKSGCYLNSYNLYMGIMYKAIVYEIVIVLFDVSFTLFRSAVP